MFPRSSLTLLALVLALATSACGYAFRSRANTWDHAQVHKIYISPLTNNTLRPGVEVVFTSALIKEFSQGGRIQITSDRGKADAVLEGVVELVESTVLSTTTADQVSKDLPLGQGLDSTYVVAQEYTARAQISLALSRIVDGKGLWAQGFANSRIYPAANQGGDIGNTGVLINNSRYTMALTELAKQLAVEAHDLFFEAF
jgi:hypothetical protein